MMNKDEIQRSGCSAYCLASCGLVMNKDEIQPATEWMQADRVVVW